MNDSFLTTYPVENPTKVKTSDWTRYLAALIKVAGADGLSKREKSAVLAVMRSAGLAPKVYGAAEKMSQRSYKELFANATALRTLAPFLIRDTLLVSYADRKLSTAEMSALRRSAKELGVTPAKVALIVKSMSLYKDAIATWKKAVR